MVFTHLPSNALLLLVPFMPTLPLAIGVLLLLLDLAMDVPTRQSYVMSVVAPPPARQRLESRESRARPVRPSPRCLRSRSSRDRITGCPSWSRDCSKIVYDLALLRAFRDRPGQ